VFTLNGKRPLGGLGSHKALFDKACGIGGWTIHDLRRTARTLLTRAGIAPDHAERCLGHVIGGVRGIYDRHQFYDEKRRAFEALATLVERIANPPANVASLDERRAARKGVSQVPGWTRSGPPTDGRHM
jgi:hypothetical protein